MVDWVTPEQSGLCTLKTGQALKCGFGFIRRKLDDEEEEIIKLSKKGVARWEQASMAIVRIEGPKADSEVFRFKGNEARYPQKYYHNSLNKRPYNLPRRIRSGIYNNIAEVLWQNPELYILLVVLPAVYGGIHITAWDLEFPSGIERLLWKIACFDIIITMVVIMGLLSLKFWQDAEFVMKTVLVIF
jgi:hypothetical protein